jgi:hypothetical protein
MRRRPVSTTWNGRRSWAKWEGDELVTYDYPSLTGLLEYYEKGEYLPDND